MRSPIVFRQQSISIESLQAMRNGLVLDPHYQRQGDVWSAPRRRLLLDSLLNGFIVPPMYWHALEPTSEYFDGQSGYAVVDGRQRLEAIFAFLDDELRLSADNNLLGDPNLQLDGVSASTLRRDHGWLYAALMRSTLEVVIIDTAEVDLIEELFSRLNDGVPLSAAERRNRGSVLAPMVRTFTDRQVFFSDRLPFGNSRYRHFDLLAKFMRIEDKGLVGGRIPDLRKNDLDRLFGRLQATAEAAPSPDLAEQPIRDLLSKVEEVLLLLSDAFTTRDKYLSSVGMVTLYYAIAHLLREKDFPPLTRDEVLHFEDLRSAAKGRDDDELSDDEARAVEFATLSQGTTSGTYLTSRLRIFLGVERHLILDTLYHDPDPEEGSNE